MINSQSGIILEAATFRLIKTTTFRHSPIIRTLRNALDVAASGNLDFRISHHRSDEFGELFDKFNALMESLKAINTASPIVEEEPQDMGATIISPSANRAA